MFVADDGLNAIVVVPGANGKMDRATVDSHAQLIRSAGMVLCQLEIPMDTLSYTLDFCAQGRRARDARSRAGRGFTVRRSGSRWRGLRPMKPRPRITWATGQTLKKARNACLRRGCAAWCSSAAEKALMSRLRAAEPEWVKPFKVDAIDTVAAGDCFNGAFAVALLEGNDPWAAARFANAAAAICVTRKGAAASMPMRAEVDEFLSAKA